MRKVLSKRYSDIKSKLKMEITKISNNDLAHLPHYFQNHKNGVSEYFRLNASDYLFENQLLKYLM